MYRDERKRMLVDIMELRDSLEQSMVRFIEYQQRKIVMINHFV
jgi:hypothetical protein